MKRFNQQGRPDKYKRPYNSSKETSISSKRNKKGEEFFDHGNYRNYYVERDLQGDAEIDARLELVHESNFVNKRILDIGCNTGNIAIAIARRYKVTKIHGVDIDNGLIEKAKTNLKLAYSLMDPDEDPEHIIIDLSLRHHYFPVSMTNMFGFMPISLPLSVQEQYTQFPFNVSFTTEDWTKKNEAEEVDQYDTILALSITKWIQLHGGDDGLKSFFKKVYHSLAEGGAFILEIYSDEQKTKQTNPSDDNEKFSFRPEDYNDFLINELGFKEHHNLGVPKLAAKGISSSPLHMYVK